MFTGLIEGLGRIESVREDGNGATIVVATELAPQIVEGDSVAVNGVCLTATEVDAKGFGAQAMHETLRRSSLGALRTGAPVNLELALRADARLGGHIVQGHVDGMAVVVGARADGFARVLDFALHADGQGAQAGESGGLARYLAEKGSVALDGVSLTVSELRDDGFSVSLIPETLQRTNLGGLQAGDRVNVEVDVLAKHVERLMGASAPRAKPVVGAGAHHAGPAGPRSLACSARHARRVLVQLALRAYQRPKAPKETQT